MHRRTALKQLAALAALATPASGAVFAQAANTYVTLDPAQPTDDPARIEVIKFFHYGCPHCADLAPFAHRWAAEQPADVHFRQIPAVWNNPQLSGLARLYFAAETTGDIDKLHTAIFTAVQQERRPLHSEGAVREWIKGKVADEKRLMDAYKSFGVNSMIQRGDQLARAMRVNSVPTLVVDGRFLTSSSMAGGHPEAMRLVGQLVDRIRRERAAA